MGADHIILMGYSLPPDDITYRAFFAARRQREISGGSVRCTVVGLNDPQSSLVGPVGIDPNKFAEGGAVTSAREIFGQENVRFCGEGVPGAFCDSAGALSAVKLEALFEWRAI